jgi:hypothetical protein
MCLCRDKTPISSLDFDNAIDQKDPSLFRKCFFWHGIHYYCTVSFRKKRVVSPLFASCQTWAFVLLYVSRAVSCNMVIFSTNLVIAKYATTKPSGSCSSGFPIRQSGAESFTRIKFPASRQTS